MTDDRDQDWRLRAELGTAYSRGALDHLLGRVRSPDVVEEVGSAVPHDVVITHDGELLFAYAATEAALEAAKRDRNRPAGGTIWIRRSS